VASISSLHCLDTPIIEHSNYSSTLNTNSTTFSRRKRDTPKHYAVVLRINVPISGQYRILNNSSMNAYGILYRDTLDPIDPSRNEIARDFRSCGNGKFRLEFNLQQSVAYILVVTTYSDYTTGTFSILIIGRSAVTFTRLSKHDCLAILIQ
jgi:hypothetical protein